MNIDLLKINEEVKEISKKQQETLDEVKRQESFRKDLIAIVQSIVAGDERVIVYGDDTCDTLDIKGKKLKIDGGYVCNYSRYVQGFAYEIKLTKSNIKKITNYINNTGFYC